jgi:lipopolysaccharide/colanic/teichoic acid biosynthesis glycosyltransferase
VYDTITPAGSLFYQRALDLVLALVLFVLTLPVMLVVALLVRLTSRGPAIYSQLRVGKDGEPFWIYKFRSMTVDAERQSGAQWSAPGDPRVTLFGRFIRATHLDELPQLINVILGQMSLVGPRPERPEFVPALSAAIPEYTDRLKVRPGVTGLAQLQLPADTDLESVRRKLAFDRWYIANRSLWLDIRVIVCTALKVIFVPMPFACWLFWIPDTNRVKDAAPAPLSWPHGNTIDVKANQPAEPQQIVGVPR